MRFGTKILAVHAPEASREFVCDWGNRVKSLRRTVLDKAAFCRNGVGAKLA
jgi:hypothetical protein